jgi:hypothetical protein
LGTALSTSVTTLPTDGSTIFVRWYYQSGGVWQFIDYTYTAYNGVPSGDSTASITSPAAPGPLSGSSATFTWSAGSGATAYWIDVGSTASGSQYYSSGSLSSSTSQATVSGLPLDGSSVYVTLYTQFSSGGQWVKTSYIYTAFNTTTAAGVITSPANGSSLPGSSVTFNWTAGSGSAYWLDVGSTQGAHDYYSSGNLGTTLSSTVNGLPTNGTSVYATLYSMISGVWTATSSSYTSLNAAAAAGVLVSPTPGTNLPGSGVTFGWSAGSSATAYWLDVGSSTGAHDYYSSGNTLGTATSDTVNGLPTDGSTVYVTLYSLVSGQWIGNTYTYTALAGSSGLAQMQTPSPGSTLSGSTATFTWTSDANATAYWVDISAVGPGGHDLDSSGNLNALTETVYNLPGDGSTIYVTLYSFVGGQWLSTGTTYVSGP